jgi:competence protein ComEA
MTMHRPLWFTAATLLSVAAATTILAASVGAQDPSASPASSASPVITASAAPCPSIPAVSASPSAAASPDASLEAVPSLSATGATGSPDPCAPVVATASPAIDTVSANTATPEELVAALEAGGVPNARQWAREVMEYRPYPTDDPTLQKLQDELAKYDPAPETLAAILSVLVP